MDMYVCVCPPPTPSALIKQIAVKKINDSVSFTLFLYDDEKMANVDLFPSTIRAIL